LLEHCRVGLGSEPLFERSRRHVLSQLVSFGRHTITALLRTQARHQRDWSADYRFYSQDRIDPQVLFQTVRQQIEGRLEPSAPLVVAMDDSLLRKTGRKIQGVRYYRDPMSPAFTVNLVRGLRVLQLSAAVAQKDGAARPLIFSMRSCRASLHARLRLKRWRATERSGSNATSTASVPSACKACASKWIKATLAAVH
jgi:hypothetical protein